MNIDWSKAPEGATHWTPDTKAVCQFLKFDEKWFWFGEEWVEFGPGTAWMERQLSGVISRPEVCATKLWSGEGLPPVGTVCAFCRFPSMPEPEWQKVEIVAHWSEGLKNPVAIFMSTSFTPQADQAIEECFRPIRTAEQIAAEEREKALKEMCATYNHETLRGWAIYVYDTLGYRKQEPAQ